MDAARLPSWLADRVGMLSDFPIGCEVGDNQGLTFQMNGTSSLDQENPADGTEGTIVIKRNLASEIDFVLLYQIMEHDGAYKGECKYGTMLDGETEVKEKDTFVIHTTYSLSDTGDYVAVGYAPWGGKAAYLLDAIVPLLVTEKKENSGNGNTAGGSGNTMGESGDDGENIGGNNEVTSGVGNSGAETGDRKDNDLQEGNMCREKKQDTGNKTIIPNVAKIKKYLYRLQGKRWCNLDKSVAYVIFEYL